MPQAADPLVQESNEQFASTWRLFARRCPSPAEARGSGWTAVFCCIPNPFFNLAFVDGPVRGAAGAERIGQEVCDFAAGQSQPWILVVCHQVVEGPFDDVCGALGGLGLNPALTMTGMVADRLVPPARALPPVEFRRVASEETRLAICHINNQAYGMTEPSGDDLVLAGERMWQADGTFGVVGYVGTEPVSCSATFLVDGRRYVGWVATLPGHQRRGYAEAAMRHSLELAAEASGIARTVLHATAAGRPVYERMGYRPMAHYTLFTKS
jgi:GNAT superfamily N-acetyltransferase